MERVFLLIALFSPPVWSGAAIELLPQERISKSKAGPCTFVHAWANWCTICLEEMPSLLRFLESRKDLRPVVIDMSTPYVQDTFSKKFMASLNPKFPTYLRPNGTTDAYLYEIDSKWSGALPYSALYVWGKQRKTWIGSLSLKTLGKEIDAVCRQRSGA